MASCDNACMTTEAALVPNVPSVSASTAKDLLKQGCTYLDVRTPEEFAKGHAEGAVNIPYLFKTEAGKVINENFLQEVEKLLSKGDMVILGCFSGGRGKLATTKLISEGYTNAVNLDGGFAAWSQVKENVAN